MIIKSHTKPFNPKIIKAARTIYFTNASKHPIFESTIKPSHYTSYSLLDPRAPISWWNPPRWLVGNRVRGNAKELIRLAKLLGKRKELKLRLRLVDVQSAQLRVFLHGELHGIQSLRSWMGFVFCAKSYFGWECVLCGWADEQLQ